MVAWSRLRGLGLERSRYIQAETGLGNFWMEATSERRREDGAKVSSIRQLTQSFPDIGNME